MCHSETQRQRTCQANIRHLRDWVHPASQYPSCRRMLAKLPAAPPNLGSSDSQARVSSRNADAAISRWHGSRLPADCHSAGGSRQSRPVELINARSRSGLRAAASRDIGDTSPASPADPTRIQIRTAYTAPARRRHGLRPLRPIESRGGDRPRHHGDRAGAHARWMTPSEAVPPGLRGDCAGRSSARL
jgi:hypothetical protein